MRAAVLLFVVLIKQGVVACILAKGANPTLLYYEWGKPGGEGEGL
jgi:hypothetical protein